MNSMIKIVSFFVMLLAVNFTHAQTYAPYTNSKAKPAAEKKPEKVKQNKTAKTAKADPPAAEIKPAQKPVAEKPVIEYKAPEAAKEDPVVLETLTATQKPVAKKPEKEEMPADLMALLQKAHKQYKEKKFEDAVTTYTEAFAISPDKYKHHVLLMRGYAYFGNKEFNKAIEDCTTAAMKTKLPHDNALGSVLFLRSLVYNSRNEAGDHERACADYRKARETGFIRGDHTFGFEDCQ